jgi:mutator protein MutT
MVQKIAVIALIERDGSYLFITQDKPGGAYPGTLHTPGGRLEIGEDPLEAIRREVLEETGIEIEDVHQVDFDSDTMVYKGEETQWIYLRYSAKYASGTPKAADDAKELRWIPKSALAAQHHNPATLRLLTKLELM